MLHNFWAVFMSTIFKVIMPYAGISHFLQHSTEIKWSLGLALSDILIDVLISCLTSRLKKQSEKQLWIYQLLIGLLGQRCSLESSWLLWGKATGTESSEVNKLLVGESKLTYWLMSLVVFQSIKRIRHEGGLLLPRTYLVYMGWRLRK